MNNTETPLPSGNLAFQHLVKDPDYFIEAPQVVFQVEDCLFRIPSYLLIMESEVFADMFKIPQPDSQNIEGSSAENPIELKGITHDDFRNLLKVLYPLSISFPKPHKFGRSRVPTGSQSEWLSILKLSTMWRFLALREQAIKELNTLRSLTPFDKITLGRRYRHLTWMMEGFKEVIDRSQPITDDEADLVGFPTAVRLFRIRENITRRVNGSGYADIGTEFEQELEDIRAEESGYTVTKTQK
ncbi:hypothetical protein B0H34DRAFT_380786 [Crassisporium funariophilum]|nr:hypothetical protein B0H34DRAFT_380786 [Crassisporium funariophilum]